VAAAAAAAAAAAESYSYLTESKKRWPCRNQ
jgi:hypothetical protein